MIHDANEDLNGDFDGQGDFYENYQQEALNRNVKFLKFICRTIEMAQVATLRTNSPRRVNLTTTKPKQ
jgi:hypothetical protein